MKQQPGSSSIVSSEEEVVSEESRRKEIDLALHIMRLEGGKELWTTPPNQNTLAVKFNDILRCTSNDIQTQSLGTIKMMRLTVIFSSSTKTTTTTTITHEPSRRKEECLAFNSKLYSLLCEKVGDIFLTHGLRVNANTMVDVRQCPLASTSFSVPSIAYIYIENCDIYFKNPTNDDQGIGRVNSKTEISISATHDVDFYKRLYQSSIPSDVSLAGLEGPMKLLEETIGMQEHERGGCCRERKPVQTADGGHFSHGLLIAGSPGCGKTLVVREAAKKLRANLLVFSAATKPIHDVSGFSDSCTAIFSRAVNSARLQPTVLLLKDLELLSSHEGKSLSESPSALIRAKLLIHLCDLFDAIPSNVSLTVVVTSNKPHLLSPKLRRVGRLQQELYINMPNESERLRILGAIVRTISPSFLSYDLNLVARQTPGYAGADLERLAHLAALKANEESCSQVSDSHIKYALSQVLPTLLQGSVGLVDIQCARATSLDHIAGLRSVKLDLIKAIVWPLKYAQAFLTMGIQPPKGILLYGPPGCCKTTLVRAVAASHQTNFLAVSAAELFSSGVGDSEKIIADLFHRARMASPCLLFIDELEAVVGSRQSSSKSKSMNETILSTFLTEMDGVGVRTPVLSTTSSSSSSKNGNVILSGPRVIVVAATNRPDLIDSALLRPGRLDRLIPVPPPDESERLELLNKTTAKIPLQEDVDLGQIARETERYSGADLVNLCNEAALFALEEDMDIQSVSMKHFVKAKAQSTPSLSLESLKLFKDYACPQIS